MNSSVNPYNSGVPAKSTGASYGQEDVFRFVRETLAAPKQNVVVLFRRDRTGKTSILHQISRRLANGFHCVFFDMQGRADQRASRVLYDLATAIAHSLGMVSPSAANFEDNGRYFLEHFLPSLYSRLAGKQLLLLLDDFDALAEEALPAQGTAGADLFPILGQLINDKTHLAFVFVVGQRVEELPNRLQRLLRQGHHKEISLPTEKPRRRLSPALVAAGAVLVMLILASIFVARELLPKPETPTPTQIAAVISPTATASPTMTASPEPSATNTPIVVPTTATSVVSAVTETPTATNTPVPLTAPPTLTETPTPTPTLPPIPTSTPTQAPISKPLGSLSVWDVDINPGDTKEIYAVVEGKGIYKTADGGNSWVLIVGRPYYTIECLSIDPKDPRILYAGLWEGILKSTDGGANWKAITAPAGSGLPLKETVHTLAVVHDNPHAVYAGTGGGVYKSLDQGQTWEARNKEIGGTSIYNIVMTSDDGERAYAAGEGAEIYQTVDGGNSPWEKLSCTYCGRGATSLAVHPDDERIVYVGDDKTQLGKSTDGGRTWELLTPSFQYSDLRISALVIDPKNPDIIYAGTGDRDNLANDGIYKSTDGGRAWKSINTGLPVDASGRHYSILTIAIDPNDSQTIYAGGYGGLYRSTNGGDSWVQQ